MVPDEISRFLLTLLSHCIPVDQCFRLHDYPPHYKKSQPLSNVNHVSVEDDSKSSSSTLPFTSQQYQQLLQMLQPHLSQATSPSIYQSFGVQGCMLFFFHIIFLTWVSFHSWILDSGAASHIACYLNFFLSYTKLSDKFVLLPNNTRDPLYCTFSLH